MSAAPTVGVLALQGGVAEHAAMLEGLGARVVRVRRPAQLRGPDGPRLDALVLPGGESSVIDRLLRRTGLAEPLGELIRGGTPTLGTCAGLILLAARLRDAAPGQRTLGGLDVTVRRNALGRQLASCEAAFAVCGLGPVRGALIRAPEIVAVGPAARVVTRFDGRILGVTSAPVGPEAGAEPAVRAGRGGGAGSGLGTVTGIAFHPELSGDPTLHRALLAQC
ncbi:pyridoxal 5'-phosphate synthase glutaminase subunit PdxT [Leucobacter luti]|uniref:glutaminase n=1 Tax=Leucobacter luti TaxID=340320 RepID=A0A4Q7U4J4_9MICO|nr:pyridoxal 5'-phosphate synthase glutaminase subunit PdxT [Leucobacter luti]RZT68585.1 pyridoxal phosphate synthase yaaE subunit [Leucobacter luti]